MKKSVFVFAFILMASFCYASEQWVPYAYQDAEGTHVVYVNESKGGNIYQEMEKMGKIGVPFVKVANLPTDRDDRNSWTIAGTQVIVDEAKKQADIAKKNAKKQKVNQLKAKMNWTDADVDTIKEALK